MEEKKMFEFKKELENKLKNFYREKDEENFKIALKAAWADSLMHELRNEADKNGTDYLKIMTKFVLEYNQLEEK
jgi:hypothetical protein